MQVQITETNYGLVRSSCFVVISFMFQQPICILFFSVFNAWKVVCKFKTKHHTDSACRIRSNNLQHENSGAMHHQDNHHDITVLILSMHVNNTAE